MSDDEILKSDNLYGYNDGSSLSGTTYRSGGGDDDGEPDTFATPSYYDEDEQEM
ncbi:MAG: hypothetical protein J1G38_06265 [Clostridiales bacterium]|nr:hypothetical protein [Clostridiales bacterium]